MDEKPTSSWDDLINKIGAQPAPDALERRRPAIENTFEAGPPPPPAPKPKPGNWNALADQLGVEIPPEESPRKAPGKSFGERLGPGAIEASFAAMEPLESGFEEIIEEEIADVEFGDAEFDDDDEDDDSLFDDDDSDLTDVEDEIAIVEDEDSGDDLPPSTLSGEAARSAFEALFQAGAGGAMAPRPTPPTRSRQDAADEIFGDAPRAPQPKRTERPERSGGQRRPTRSADVDQGADEPSERPATDEGDGERRPRRRRRRGGRRRDGSPRSPRADEAPASARGVRDDDDEWRELDAEGDDEAVSSSDDDREVQDEMASSNEESRGDRPRRRRSRRGRGGRTSGSSEPREGREAGEARAPARNGRAPQRPARADDEDDDDEADDMASLSAAAGDDDEDDDDSSSSRSAHKSIPTWSEAIGVMVETNMLSRKNSPQRPSSPRGGGGRGRSRGGRGGRGGGRDGGGGREGGGRRS